MFKGGMGNIMKQAQQMQEKMQKAQEELQSIEVIGELVVTCRRSGAERIS